MDFDIEKHLYNEVKNFLTNNTCTRPEKIKTSEQILKDIEKAVLDIKTNGFIIEESKQLYYTISNMVEKGNIIHMMKTKFNPEYVVFNREDFEENEELILSLGWLRPISDLDYFKNMVDGKYKLW